ncbi:MAG: glycosyltransferase family 39 protein [Candidatus Colwellbacteria bacterium]|nr:glycosyltransferase family 39 protein [Candidatus Colwellbacteria bacterium]
MTLTEKFILGLILVAIFGLMLSVSLEESAIMDELAHIPAGFSYVKLFDYRLNPEHPPLVKMLAGLPLAFMDLNFPTESTSWQDDVNGQWVTGTEFLYESGNNADQIIAWARVGPMLLTLVLIFFTYFWAKEMMGAKWAFLPTLMVAFSPTVLAHGHYVTTDIGAALGFLVATYYFIRFLNYQSKRNLWLAGIAFGFAQLLKFSTVLLVPLVILLVLIFSGIKAFQKKSWRTIGIPVVKTFLIFLIGLAVIYPFYLLTTINYPPEKQAADTEFILTSFAGGRDPARESCKPLRCVAEATIWASDKPLLRPMAQYLLGIEMVLQRSAGGNTVYFLGEVSADAGPLYFPVVYKLKEPIPILILIAIAFLFSLYQIGKSIAKKSASFTNYLGTHQAEFALLTLILVYGLYSITSPLNIGVRHLLPILPPIYLLTAGSLKNWVMADKSRKKMGFVLVMTAWLLVEAVITYPHYLSYFNEAVGTNNGWRYVTDSNYDWGQDMKRLKAFATKNPEIDKIAIDYFGGASPSYYLGSKFVAWQSNKGNPLDSDIKWFAISVNTLQNATAMTASDFERKAEDEYQWLKKPYEPYARAGKSIFIYKLD